MIKMFTPHANFKGISDKPVLSPGLHVADVLQKAFIEVDEKGTEAAAITSKSNCIDESFAYFIF